MNIIIAAQSDKPIYQQIFDQLSSQIIKGEIECNTNLPSIRTAAKELRVSIITVKKAWEELERHGLIYTQVGKGCFVADIGKESMEEKRDALLEDKLLKDVDYYKELGYTLDELLERIKLYWDE